MSLQLVNINPFRSLYAVTVAPSYEEFRLRIEMDPLLQLDQAAANGIVASIRPHLGRQRTPFFGVKDT